MHAPAGSQPMQIGYLNVVPKVDDHGSTSKDPTFDDINETIFKFNQWCQQYPIPGMSFKAGVLLEVLKNICILIKVKYR